MSYTKVPWKVTDTCSNYIFNVVRIGTCDIRVDTEENARLIATAPELLEALSCLLDNYTKHLSEDVYTEKAYWAIAKATGQQEHHDEIY
jgi:predicted RNA-binding protein Jag